MTHTPGPSRDHARLIAAAPDLLEAGVAQTQILTKAQAIMTSFLEPGGLGIEETISELLELLDGPEQREAQSKWDAAVAKVEGRS